MAQQEGGFDFNRIYDDRTPLIAAVLGNQRKSIEVILELGASPDMADTSGITPLMHAVIDDNRGMARLLMQFEAALTVKDNTGRNATRCSRSESMDEVLSASAE